MVTASVARAAFVMCVADGSTSSIRQISQNGTVSLFALVPDQPLSLAFDPNGTLYVGCGQVPGIARVLPGHNAGTGFGNALPYIPGIAVDGSGNVYAAEQRNGMVASFNSSGSAITTPIQPSVSGPSGMAFDSQGDLFIADLTGNAVVEVTPSGTQSVFATITSPLNVAFDSAGNLYVSTIYPGVGQNEGEIDKFNLTGGETVFASPATAPLGVFTPDSMAFGPDGNLYVVNTLVNSIDEITSAGTVSIFSTKVSDPTAIAFEPTVSVPEPSGMAMLCIGCIAALRRRRGVLGRIAALEGSA